MALAMICVCGHHRNHHTDGTARCTLILPDTDGRQCECVAFRQIEELGASDVVEREREREAAIQAPANSCPHWPQHRLWVQISRPSQPLCKMANAELIRAGQVCLVLQNDIVRVNGYKEYENCALSIHTELQGRISAVG